MCKVSCTILLFLFVFCIYYFRSSSKLNRTENIPRWLFAGGLMSYLRYVCLFSHSGVKHILFCFSSSCLPYVARFSGLYICDCHFGIL